MTLQQKTSLIVNDKFYQADLMFECKAGANPNDGLLVFLALEEAFQG